MEGKEGFFGNMLGYEIVLFIFGAILMIVVIAGFIYQLKKDRLKSSYGLFILLPLPFMGFPAFETISFMKDLFKLEKYALELAENPQDEQVQKVVEDLTKDISEEPNRSERQLYALSEANIALGNLDQAERLLEKVEPNNERKEIDLARIELHRANQLLKIDPTAQVSESLQNKVAKLKVSPRLASLDKAAIQNVEKALSRDQ